MFRRAKPAQLGPPPPSPRVSWRRRSRASPAKCHRPSIGAESIAIGAYRRAHVHARVYVCMCDGALQRVLLRACACVRAHVRLHVHTCDDDDDDNVRVAERWCKHAVCCTRACLQVVAEPEQHIVRLDARFAVQLLRA